MQTPLLGLAIAIIVAAVVALVGPLFVDWNRYRAEFEAEATRLVGLPVRVSGAIDARLLPAPSVTLGGITVGAGEEMRARSLALEFSLGALVRGQWRAVEMRLAGPQFNLALDRSGRLGLPAAAAGFDVETLAIDRLNVDDGRAVLTDVASGSRLILDKLWFDGEVRSLIGPFRGEGAFVIGGELYGYRISASRAENDGLKIKLGIDPSHRPLSMEAEGQLSLDREAPRFEGALSLVRPAGVVLPGGKSELKQPWRATAHVKATPASALFEQIEFQYGAEERALKLGGTAELKFGERPRLDAVLSARQLNLDRLLADTDAQRRLPFAAIKALAQDFAGTWRPRFPIAIGVGIDTVMLGGAPIQSLRGDIAAGADGWNLQTLEFRAPGLTEVTLSGRLDVTATSAGFSGPVEVSSADPKTLVAWLEGRGETPSGPVRAMRARGEVTLASERVAIERLDAEIDRKNFTGRIAYVWATNDRRARLDAVLNAGELDVDGLLGFAKMALAGTSIDPPGEVSLAVDVGRATIAGIEARQARAMLRLDGNGLVIEKLSFADLGGAALEASGRIDTAAPSPRGTVTLDLDAKNFSGIALLASTFLPQASDPIRRLADRVGAIKLRATLDVNAGSGDAARIAARLAVEGKAGAVRLNLQADASGEGLTLRNSQLRAEGKFDADDGAALLDLAGLDGPIAAAPGPGRLAFSLEGSPENIMNVSGQFAAGKFQASAEGTARLDAEDGASADLRLSVADADLRKLAPASALAVQRPLSFTAKLTLAGGKMTLENIAGKLAGTAMHGRLGFDLSSSPRIEGRIDTDDIDAALLIAAAAGMPKPPPGEAGIWTGEPFRPGLFFNLDGGVEFSAERASLTPAVVASNVRGRICLSGSEIAIEDIEGSIAGGRFKGKIAVRKEGEGLSAHTNIALDAAEAAALIVNTGGSPIAGRIGLKLELDGMGLSPRALIGSLGGTGSFSLDGARIAGLDPKAFAAAARAVDQGLAIDPQRLRNIVAPALDAGSLTMPHAQGAISVAAGQARLSTIVARGEGADITVTGGFDFVQQSIDGRVTLSGPKSEDTGAGRPDIVVALKGPYAAPSATLDLSALAGWLAIRSVDLQTKRLRDIEAQRRKTEQEIERAIVPPVEAPALPPPVEIAPSPGKRAPPRSGNAAPQSVRPRAEAGPARAPGLAQE